MQEGQALRLEGHRLRCRGEYAAAGQAFLRAAELGDAHACFEMAYALLCGGGLGFLQDFEEGQRYAIKGALAGSALCRTLAEDLDLPPMYENGAVPDVEARVLVWDLHRGSILDSLTTDELVTLQRRCKESVHNPWPYYFLSLAVSRAGRTSESSAAMEYAARMGLVAAQLAIWNDGPYEMRVQPTRQGNQGGSLDLLESDDLLRIATPRDIANALSTVIWCDVDHPDSDITSILMRNERGLSADTLSQVRFYVGKFLYETMLVDEDQDVGPDWCYCVRHYRRAQRRAQDAAVAWLGCFKRRRLPWMCKDTAVLVAKAIASSECPVDDE